MIRVLEDSKGTLAWIRIFDIDLDMVTGLIDSILILAARIDCEGVKNLHIFEFFIGAVEAPLLELVEVPKCISALFCLLLGGKNFEVIGEISF